MAHWRLFVVKKWITILAVLLLATTSLTSCATAVITDSSLDCEPQAAPIGMGDAPTNLDLFMAVKHDAKGNSKLALSMLEGSYIESAWNNKAVGGGAYGVYQIQGPGVTHPDITIVQAENPAYATNYMLPAYSRALASVSTATWSSDPARAAMRVALDAERPAGWPISNPHYDATFRTAFKYAVGAMEKVGIPTSFGGGAQPGKTVRDISLNQSASDSCSGNSGSTETGDAKTLAQKILANPRIDLNGFAAVKQDVIDASKGNPGSAGAMTSAAVLRVIATLGQNHSVLITAIQSNGTHHCWRNGVPHGPGSPYGPCPFQDQHYLGNAVDIGAIDGVPLSGRDFRSIAVINIFEKVLTSGEFGQSECPGANPVLKSGFIDFPDSCTHLHFDTKTQAGE